MINPPEQPSEVERVGLVARLRRKASELEEGHEFFADEIADEFLLAAAALEAMRAATPAPCAAPSLTPNGGSVTIDRNIPAPVQDDYAKFLRNLADDCEHGIEPGRRQWERLRKIAARLSTDTALVEALTEAIGTLAASRHLILKYTPDHHWLTEHDRRIADLKALLASRGGDK